MEYFDQFDNPNFVYLMFNPNVTLQFMVKYRDILCKRFGTFRYDIELTALTIREMCEIGDMV